MVQQLYKDKRGSPDNLPALKKSKISKTEKKETKPTYSRSANHIVFYFKEMARYSTLASEEEISLGLAIREKRVGIWNCLLNFDVVRDTIFNDITEEKKEIPFMLIELQEFLANNKRSIDSAILKKKKELIGSAAEVINKLDLDEIIMQKSVLRVNHFLGLKKKLSKKMNSLNSEMNNYIQDLSYHKNRFIKANLRLVISVARRYNKGPMNLIDLIQEGNIGLMKAVSRFDPDRGYRFSTYAAWWIRHAVSRASADKGRTVRLPVHFIESYQQLMKIKKKLQLTLNRVPTSDEVADEMGITRRKVDRIQGYLREGSLSLDRKVNSSDSRSFLELLEDPKSEDGICSTVIKKKEISMSELGLNEVLTAMERDIILKRFGLHDENPCTLKEIGAIYNLSRERIRQIQENSLKKLRKFFSEREML